MLHPSTTGRRCAAPHLLAVTAALLALPTLAAGPLNDTGITFCGAYPRGISAPCLGTEPAGQDAHYGRDAAAARGILVKKGGGEAGFDYTKIANDGSDLPADAILGDGSGDWGCSRDNVTGLTWEVKTDDGGLRDKDWTYTWYDSVHNYLGNPGKASGTTNCKTPGRCDTEKFVHDVNVAGLCGHADWRMPDLEELYGLANKGRSNPAIDPTYFPNTIASFFWSGSPVASDSSGAWLVHFGDGVDYWYYRDYAYYVRLVRAGQ
jgi:hypothetical protein